MGERSNAAKAAKAEAHLYVWGAVVSILEGGATPGRHDAKAHRAVKRVIDIANAECQRMLKDYDKHIAATTAKGESK